MHLLVFLALMSSVSLAQEQEPFLHPARARLVLHADFEIQEHYALRGEFIPAENFVEGIAPLVIVELGGIGNEHLEIAPALGYAFADNEIIISTRFMVEGHHLTGWFDIETQPQSWFTYWIAQIDYRFSHMVRLGIDEESWGELNDSDEMNHGAGPNLILENKHVKFEIAVHVRYHSNGDVKLEFVNRMHVYF